MVLQNYLSQHNRREGEQDCPRAFCILIVLRQDLSLNGRESLGLSYLIAAVPSFLHTHRLRVDTCTWMYAVEGYWWDSFLVTGGCNIVQKGPRGNVKFTHTGASIAIFLLTPAEIINYRRLQTDPPPLSPAAQCMCSEVDVKEQRYYCWKHDEPTLAEFHVIIEKILWSKVFFFFAIQFRIPNIFVEVSLCCKMCR